MPNPEFSPGLSAAAGGEEVSPGNYEPGQAIRRTVTQEVVRLPDRRDPVRDAQDIFIESLSAFAETGKGNEGLIAAVDGLARELSHCALFGTGAEQPALTPEYAERLRHAVTQAAALLRSTRA